MDSIENHIAQHDPIRRRNPMLLSFMILLLLLCVLVFIFDLGIGSVYIPPMEIFRTLVQGNHENELWYKIIFMIRLPKAISAILAGAALAVAGLQMQTLFHNPLAGPSVLGITAGASLGVAVVMLTSGGAASIYAIRQMGIGGSWLIVIASCLGAALIMGLILMLSLRIRDNVSLLIIGIMVGNIAISLVSIWQYFSEPEQIQDYLMWTFGSLGGVTIGQLHIFSIAVAFGLLMTFLNSKSLNTLLLGENYARSLGLNVFRTRTAIILTSSLLTGAVTGFCGPIAFIGIAVPHLSRLIFNTSDHKALIPGSLLIGALVMLCCDIISQVPGSQISLPINAITALLGSPVVVWVILHKRNFKGAF